MKIATCAYQPEWHADWGGLAAKLDARVAGAAGQGAELLIFPEYAGVEAGLIGSVQEKAPTDWVATLCPLYDRWTALHSDLAEQSPPSA